MKSYLSNIYSKFILKSEIRNNSARSISQKDILIGPAISRWQKNYIENGSGHIMLSGKFRGKPIKIYEAKNSDHSAFIKKVSTNSQLLDLFPKVYFVRGRFVFADWIVGQEKPNSDYRLLLQCLSRIHRTKIDVPNSKVFDYWHDFLKPRFLRASELVGKQNLALKAENLISQYWDSQKPFLSHPDITFPNIVFSEEEIMFVVDNEFLSIGRLSWLDFFNTLNSLPKTKREEATDYWKRDLQNEVSPNELFITELAWKTRVIGSLLQIGNLVKLNANFEKIESLIDSGKDIQSQL